MSTLLTMRRMLVKNSNTRTSKHLSMEACWLNCGGDRLLCTFRGNSTGHISQHRNGLVQSQSSWPESKQSLLPPEILSGTVAPSRGKGYTNCFVTEKQTFAVCFLSLLTAEHTFLPPPIISTGFTVVAVVTVVYRWQRKTETSSSCL